MTTFGLQPSVDSVNSEDIEQPSATDVSKPVPNINVVPADDANFLSSGSSDSGYAHDEQEEEDFIALAEREGERYTLIPTQPQSQPQVKISFDAEQRPDQHLIACLMPATTKFRPFELLKTKPDGIWRIGRHPSNDLVLDGGKLSNFHCTLKWNGKNGKDSEVSITDGSSNGTWVNNNFLNKHSSTILRGGVSVSLGCAPDMLSDWRFVFRDIEGLSSLHMKQIWAKYDLSYELGSGAFARVLRCVNRNTGNEYAVKIIDRKKLGRSKFGESSVIREINILTQLAEFRHKNIVTLYESFEEEESIYLVMEMVRGGDLLTYIAKSGALPEQQVRRMAAQICHAVAYIHSQGIAHRDLKPENIMVTEGPNPDCKVADFGLAKLVESGTFLRTMCGTPVYLAPEVMLRGNISQAYDNKVDSWSLGVIFYCMLTNCSPFLEPYDSNGTPEEQRKYFCEREIQWNILDGVRLSEEGNDFLRHLLAEDPRNRKTVAAMLDHSWISLLVPSDSQFQHPIQPAATMVVSPQTDEGDACSQSFDALTLNPSQMAIPGLGLTAPSLDVTTQIPGAFPASQSWEMVTTPAKRKNLIEGSSPLSSLSDSDSETPEPEPARKRSAARKRAPPSRRKKAASPERPAPAPAPAPARRSGRATRPTKAPRYV